MTDSGWLTSSASGCKVPLLMRRWNQTYLTDDEWSALLMNCVSSVSWSGWSLNPVVRS